MGDPTQMGSAGGAILELFANGANSSSQTLVLAQGTTSTGKAFWSGDVTKSFKGARSARGRPPLPPGSCHHAHRLYPDQALAVAEAARTR